MTTPSLPLLNSLLRRPSTAAAEAQVLELLRTAAPSELDALVRGVDPRRLIAALDDRLLGPDHRSDLIELLTMQRVADLSLEARAAVSLGLQAGWTTHPEERGIRNLLLASQGAELTHFKNLLNARSDVHDLEALIFFDVADLGLRDEILAHIAAEAVGVRPGKAKTLSDIDDTVVARLHDTRYPKGTLYPGVLALFEALDAGPDDQPFSTGDLTFVTARPMDAFGLIENATRASLRKAGISTMSVLSGSFFNLHSHDAMAAGKLANIDHYHRLFPEYRLVFLGDSGQGDVAVGQRLRELYPHALDVVLIHDVVGTPPEQRAAYAASGIHLFDTYVGAALLLRRLGLISQAAAQRVIAETHRGLDAIRWQTPEQEQRMRDSVARDIAGAGLTPS